MNLEDTLTATFVEHEELAPEAGPVLVAIHDALGRRRARRAPRRVAVVAAVAAVAAVAVTIAVVAGSTGDGRRAAVASPSAPTPAGAPFRFERYTAPGTVIPSDQRQVAEPIGAPLLDGEGTVALAAYAGHATVLTWVASWCGPCRNSYLGEPFRSPGPDFLVVDVKDARAAALTYFDTHRSAAPVLFDPEGSTLRGLGNLPGAVPVTVLVDRDQRVAGVYEGVVTKRQLIASISRL